MLGNSHAGFGKRLTERALGYLAGCLLHSVRGGGCDSPRLLGGQVPSLLCHPLAGRTGRDAAEVDLAAGELNKEEDVEAMEPGRLDGGEVRRQHLGCMLADELSPGDLAAARSGQNAGLRRILATFM